MAPENAFNWDHCRFEVKHESNDDKKTLLKRILKLFIFPLTIRPWNTYMYIFIALFDFWIFLTHFLLFLEATTKLIQFCTKVLVKQAIFWTSKFTAAQQNRTTKILVFFRDFKIENEL